MVVSNRALDRINTTLLAAVVLLSWGFVLYASWVSAQWQLEVTAGTRQHP